MIRRARLVIVVAALAALATACFPADGRWRTFGPPGSGADLRYGLLFVQQTSPQGPSARCTFEFTTPGGEFIGAMDLGNPLLFNMTPPFNRVRLRSTGGATCLATQVSEAQGRRYLEQRTVSQVYNFGDLLNAECAAADTWPDPEPGQSLYGIVTATGDVLEDCEKFDLA
jgi:hypothetical protein